MQKAVTRTSNCSAFFQRAGGGWEPVEAGSELIFEPLGQKTATERKLRRSQPQTSPALRGEWTRAKHA
ncbi:hypothetical protein YDYSG_35970 [Paenibacillus tyrfis]|nr:hypothetical protein YDYSG_35970 [Paenibacillus tyrfis]GMX62392.1 hypothetical protein Elgi_21970 [Paenibacillus elgii]